MTRVAFIVLSSLVMASSVQAKEKRHRVLPGETASGLAKHYYGASWKGSYILTRNELVDNALPVGKRIAIPASWTYTARRGDSYASIAKRMVGKAERYPAILRFNRLSERLELEVGQELLMPFHLRHSVAKGESLSQISRRYYRTAKLGSFLKEYNELSSSKLEVGQRITVPIFDRNTIEVADKPAPDAPNVESTASVQIEEKNGDDQEAPEDPADEDPVVADADMIADEGPDSPAAVDEADGPAATAGLEPASADLERPAETTDTPELVLESVDSAVEAYRGGYFRAACPAFEKMLEGKGLAPRERSRVIRYLGFCSVAFGDGRAARDYFRSWLLTDPEATLDRRQTSPKILEVFDEVAEEVRR